MPEKTPLERVCVVGARGMLGSDLMEELQTLGCEAAGLDLPECDITDCRQCLDMLSSMTPRIVINCAAYTNVDRAESEREAAFRVNAQGAANVASACAQLRARCIYISTDYVFDGTKAEPYAESDAPNPTSVYGASKLEGERLCQSALQNLVIARTSWLYGARGKNFVTTILAAARAGKALRVVSDQFGAPTYTRDLARVLIAVAASSLRGVLHATNSGACSWFEFANAILDLTQITPASLTPIPGSEYPSPVIRPHNSRLQSIRIREAGIPPLPSWQDALARFLLEIGELRKIHGSG